MTFTFEEFCKRMQAETIKYLPDDYKDCKTVIMPCNKPGKHYTGLYIAVFCQRDAGRAPWDERTFRIA